jgi:hypothetical protein
MMDRDLAALSLGVAICLSKASTLSFWTIWRRFWMGSKALLS